MKKIKAQKSIAGQLTTFHNAVKLSNTFLCVLLLVVIPYNIKAATYTWNNLAGGLWTTTGNWTPASPAGGPPSGSDIIIPALTDNTRAITSVPQITLVSVTCTGAGFTWLQSASSGQTVSISGSWSVPASHTLTIGTNSRRMCWTLLNTSTSTINGGVAFDAGNTNRLFVVHGTLIVNSTGLIYDPNPSGGSDFYFMPGANLITQKIQGWTTTAAPNVAGINTNVAVCAGGTYSYATGVNYEYTGTAFQITGLGLSQNTPSNVLINCSVGQRVTLSANTRISGNLTINANSTFSTNALTFSIGATSGAGGLINNGTLNAGTGTFLFNGNAAQTISGSSTSTFRNLTLNNASGLTLLSPAEIGGALTLTSGLLSTTTTNLLTLLNAATAPALTAASTSYVNGPLRYQKSTSGSTTLNFPVGKSPDCRPMQLVVNHANTNLYNYVGESFNASAKSLGYTLPGTIDTVSNVHYWDMTRTDNVGASQPTLDLAGTQTLRIYFNANDGVRDLATLRIVKNTYSASTTWIDLAGGSTGGTTGNGNITSVGFNSFSRFTLAGSSSGINPLPVSLSSFAAIPTEGGKVKLEWSTETEINNDYFTIERSNDCREFEVVEVVAGAGNSNTHLDYFTYDDQTFTGTKYYRLKQTDLDGRFKYHRIVAVELNKQNNKIMIYPNPGKGLVHFGFGDTEQQVISTEIVNSLGQKVYFGYGTLQVIELKEQPAGVYFVTIQLPGRIISEKLVLED